MEFEEVIKKISIFNEDNNHEKIVIDNNVPEPSKDLRGNSYDLEQFNWQIGYANYKQKVRNAKKGLKEKVFNEFENIHSIQDQLKINEFSKDWNKMNIPCKKIKISEYLDNLLNKNKINKAEHDNLKKKYFIQLHNKLLKKKM